MRDEKAPLNVSGAFCALGMFMHDDRHTITREARFWDYAKDGVDVQ